MIYVTPQPKWHMQQPHIMRAQQLQQLRTAHNTTDFDMCTFGHHCKDSTRILVIHWPELIQTIQQRPHRSKCTCTQHNFDMQHQQQVHGTLYLPPALTDLIVSTLQLTPRSDSIDILDDADYAAYLPLDPYYLDHLVLPTSSLA